MKYNHMVKYKGNYYPTGADVPVGSENPKPVEEVKAGTKTPPKKGK